MGSSVAGLFLCVIALSVGEAGAEAIRTRVLQQATPTELPVKRDGGSFQQRCTKGESGGKFDSPCIINANIKTESLLFCHRQRTAYWPPGWNSMRGGGCAHPPTLDGRGKPLPCKEVIKWSDHGMVIRSGGTSTWGWWILFRAQMPRSRPSSLGKIISMHAMCQDFRGKFPLFWKMNLVPEPPPEYNSLVIFRHNEFWAKRHTDYLVNLQRGDGFYIKLIGTRDPPKALTEGGQYCSDKEEGTSAKCKKAEEWEDVGVAVKQAAWPHSATMLTDPRDVGGGVQDTFFKVIYRGFERRFQIRLHPTVTPRFIHSYFYEGGFQVCQPSDGPTPQQICDGGVVVTDTFIYVNCTDVGDFDPPDINSTSGSFCTEAYTDYSTPCKTTRKWSEIFKKPDVRKENQLFSVYSGSDNLKDSAKVYGRCGNKQGAVLFFLYEFAGSRGSGGGGCDD